MDSKRIVLVQALEALMRERPLDEIKVTQLCKAADISRSTFYDYFIDIYDVANWFWGYLQQNGLFAIGSSKSLCEGNLVNFQHLVEYRDFFQEAFKSTTYNSLLEHGYRVVQKRYEDIVTYRLGRPLTAEESLILSVYGSGAVAVAKDWARNGMAESPTTMAAAFEKSCPAWIKKLLEPGTLPDSLEQHTSAR